MLDKVPKIALTIAGLGALALGGAAISEAADSGSQGHVRPDRASLSSDVAAKVKAPALDLGPGRGGRFGPGTGPGPGPGETALTGDTKQQVEDAVRAEYPGATIVRTETNGDSAAPYESHVQTSAGEELEVLVSKDFKVVDARQHPAHP